jgi:adenylate cyclase
MSDHASYQVTSRPDGRAASVREDQTLLAALLAAGIPITHACGGKARCSTCRVRVEDGADVVCPRTDDESEMAAKLHFDDATRLACRARVSGDAVVRRLVLDDCDECLTTRIGPEVLAGVAGREENVAILFSDVAGFTPLSEKLPPYDVIHLLNRWFLQAGEDIDAAGGRIDNYMGDGLLAVFQGETCGLGAVRAALAMQESADEMSEYTQRLYGEPFGVRVGIHHGCVVIGDLGAAHNRRETVIGDAVNIASRIEAANKEAGTRILVSEPVMECVRDAVEAGCSHDISLKGKTGTFRLHEIVGLR